MRGKREIPVKATGLRQWPKPFHLLDEWPNDFGGFWPRDWKVGFPLRENGDKWMPKMDAFKKDGKLMVKAELPGLEKKDVHVTMEGGNLVVKGERLEEKEIKEEDYFRAERTFGTFYRRLPLPEGIDTEKIHATFDKGLLEIELPLPEEPKTETREIELN